MICFVCGQEMKWSEWDQVWVCSCGNICEEIEDVFNIEEGED